jgi:probable dihydroxyacetone kinase regulator
MSQMTKKALAASLKNILQKKPLSQITINEITDGCGVNRMTFYYHFKDIYDLVEWICIEDAGQVLAGKRTPDTWQQAYMNIFHILRDNRALILNLSNADSRDRLRHYLYELVDQVLDELVEDEAEDADITDNEKTFVFDFYKYALVGILLNWIDKDMKEDPKQIVNMLSTYLSDNISDSLDQIHNCRKRLILLKNK